MQFLRIELLTLKNTLVLEITYLFHRTFKVKTATNT